MTSIALHLGLNAVDPDHYAGWDGRLAACENDANAMATLTRAAGFTAEVALTRDARAERVLDFLERATALRAGDSMVLTFAGHGAQIAATDPGEVDGLDETWALYDRMVLDNEIRAALERLAVGVNALVVLDCCHSGTAIRAALATAARATGPRVRGVPGPIASATVAAHRSLYRRARAAAAQLRVRAAGGPDAVLLAACQDEEVAADGDLNGLFTGTLLQVWDRGRFAGDHRGFVAAIAAHMPTYQRPALDSFGPGVERLLRTRPFSPGTATPTTTSNEQEHDMATNDINGDWTEVLAALDSRGGVRGDGGFLAQVIAQNAQAAQRAFFGGAATVSPTPARAASRGGTVVRAFWWGWHVEISHEDLEVFLSAADPINAMIGAIGGGIPSPAAPFIALAAAFVAGALGLLRGLDHGRGVYVSMSWFAPGIFVPTSV